MKNSIFLNRAPHLEPSELTAFSGNKLDRDSEHRDETSLETALKVEGTHILAFSGTQLVLKHDGQVLDPADEARHAKFAGRAQGHDRAVLGQGRPWIGGVDDGGDLHRKHVDAAQALVDQQRKARRSHATQ